MEMEAKGGVEKMIGVEAGYKCVEVYLQRSTLR